MADNTALQRTAGQEKQKSKWGLDDFAILGWDKHVQCLCLLAGTAGPSRPLPVPHFGVRCGVEVSTALTLCPVPR